MPHGHPAHGQAALAQRRVHPRQQRPILLHRKPSHVAEHRELAVGLHRPCATRRAEQLRVHAPRHQVPRPFSSPLQQSAQPCSVILVLLISERRVGRIRHLRQAVETHQGSQRAALHQRPEPHSRDPPGDTSASRAFAPRVHARWCASCRQRPPQTPRPPGPDHAQLTQSRDVNHPRRKRREHLPYRGRMTYKRGQTTGRARAAGQYGTAAAPVSRTRPLCGGPLALAPQGGRRARRAMGCLAATPTPRTAGPCAPRRLLHGSCREGSDSRPQHALSSIAGAAFDASEGGDPASPSPTAAVPAPTPGYFNASAIACSASGAITAYPFASGCTPSDEYPGSIAPFSSTIAL